MLSEWILFILRSIYLLLKTLYQFGLIGPRFAILKLFNVLWCFSKFIANKSILKIIFLIKSMLKEYKPQENLNFLRRKIISLRFNRLINFWKFQYYCLYFHFNPILSVQWYFHSVQFFVVILTCCFLHQDSFCSIIF